MPRLGLGLGLKRRGGAAAFTPPDISGCILWLRADLGTTVTGAGVSLWEDQSGNGNDADQTTDADRPALNATGWSTGLPTVDFDLANTEWLDMNGLSDASTAYTVFAVLDKLTDSVVEQMLTGDVTQLQFASERTTGVGMYDGAWKVYGTTQLGEQALTWRVDGAGNSSEVWRDGTSIGSDGWAAGRTLGGQVALGSSAVGGGQHADMQLAEIIVYNTALSAGDLARVHTYLLARYGL